MTLTPEEPDELEAQLSEALAALEARGMTLQPEALERALGTLQPGPLDLTGETMDLGDDTVSRRELPDGVVRVRSLVILAVTAGLAFAMNVGFALLLAPEKYAVIGALFGTLQSVLTGLLGAGLAYYFKDRPK